MFPFVSQSVTAEAGSISKRRRSQYQNGSAIYGVYTHDAARMKSIVVLAGYDNCTRGYHGVETGTVGREDVGMARLALGFGADTGTPR